MQEKSTDNKTKEGYNGIFLERSGKDSLALVEKLLAPPEFPLDDNQKQEVYDYEKTIYNHELDSGVTVEEAIESHQSTSRAPMFFAEAFLSDKVEFIKDKDLNLSSSQDVYKWLAEAVRDQTISLEDMRKMSKDSINYYIDKISNDIISDNTPDQLSIDNMVIVLEPDKFLDNARQMTEIRQLLHQNRQQYKEGGDKLDGAKRAICDIYLAKINSYIVADDLTIDCLMKQSELVDDESTINLAQSIISPTIKESLNSHRDKTLRRFDYLRNGIGLDENGKATAVDDLVVQEASKRLETSDKEKLPTLFTPNQTKKIKQFMLQPSEMVNIFKEILSKANLLSSEDSSTWNPNRSHRARDELFQVVESPTSNNFSVIGKSGAFLVSSKERSLYDVIVVGTHELEHVNQAQANLEVGRNIRIAKLRGKRLDTLLESGANRKQRETELELFGKSKPISLAYARAVQAIESGGNIWQASQAFYKQKRLEQPEASFQSQAREAADRVLRITRNGGLSSWVMSYSEELLSNYELSNEGVSQSVKDRAGLITNIELVDQARLHKYGLLDLPSSSVDWSEYILTTVKPYIDICLSVVDEESK